MKTRDLEESYGIFSELLGKHHIYMDSSVTFSLLCRWIGADKGGLDELLLSELGMRGDAILRELRRKEYARISERLSGRGSIL